MIFGKNVKETTMLAVFCISWQIIMKERGVDYKKMLKQLFDLHNHHHVDVIGVDIKI